MQELLKKNSPGKNIIIGVMILAASTLAVKMLFYKTPKTTGEQLRSMADETNEKTPFYIDSSLRVDSVLVLPDSKIRYHYTILTLDRNSIDTALLIKTHKEEGIKRIKSDPTISFFRENLVEIQSQYFDKEGKPLCFVTISPYDYLKE
jgi:hypothetical protein